MFLVVQELLLMTQALYTPIFRMSSLSQQQRLDSICGICQLHGLFIYYINRAPIYIVRFMQILFWMLYNSIVQCSEKNIYDLSGRDIRKVHIEQIKLYLFGYKSQIIIILKILIINYKMEPPPPTRYQRRKAKRQGNTNERTIPLTQSLGLHQQEKEQENPLAHMQFFSQPIIQVYFSMQAIQLNFLKKDKKDIQTLELCLKPLKFVAIELETKWMVILYGADVGYQKVINQLIKKWQFPTLLNNWMKEEKMLEQYFGKGNTFKKMEKQCCVCLESKNLKFNQCCASNICDKCEKSIKIKECPICRHPIGQLVKYLFPTLQKLKHDLPNCLIVPDKQKEGTNGISFEE